MFVTIAIAGNSSLGGEDFTHRLFMHGLKEFDRRHGHALTDPSALQAMRSAAEQVKQKLSSEPHVNYEFNLEHQNRVIDTVMSVARLQFESLCQDLFDKLLVPVSKVGRLKTGAETIITHG
eukprot:m.286085 g.286085  ORF g.286085 m.286085 type:complete len:121 (+) comp19436_c0_seq17:885-1247(+)